jgi:CheY-like chemotaxis protein
MSNEVILIVEDDVEIAEVLADLIEEIGLKCIVANNGLVALQKIHQFHEIISLVLCDVKMPHMNGLEFIRKSLNDVGYIPFVMMTASSKTEYEEVAQQLGVIDYLPKPFEINDLINKIPVWIKIGKKKQR